MSKAATLTTKQLQQAFGVAHMTVYNWRQGTATKDALPFEVSDPKAVKPRISYKVSVVKAWAKRNGVDFAVAPEKILASTGARDGKPGPKPRKRVEH